MINLVTISGPTASGKDSVSSEILKNMDLKFEELKPNVINRSLAAYFSKRKSISPQDLLPEMFDKLNPSFGDRTSQVGVHIIPDHIYNSESNILDTFEFLKNQLFRDYFINASLSHINSKLKYNTNFLLDGRSSYRISQELIKKDLQNKIHPLRFYLNAGIEVRFERALNSETVPFNSLEEMLKRDEEDIKNGYLVDINNEVPIALEDNTCNHINYELAKNSLFCIDTTNKSIKDISELISDTIKYYENCFKSPIPNNLISF